LPGCEQDRSIDLAMQQRVGAARRCEPEQFQLRLVEAVDLEELAARTRVALPCGSIDTRLPASFSPTLPSLRVPKKIHNGSSVTVPSEISCGDRLARVKPILDEGDTHRTVRRAQSLEVFGAAGGFGPTGSVTPQAFENVAITLAEILEGAALRSSRHDDVRGGKWIAEAQGHPDQAHERGAREAESCRAPPTFGTRRGPTGDPSDWRFRLSMQDVVPS
jgi:hypothetical protein